MIKPTHKTAMEAMKGPNFPRLKGPGSKSLAFRMRTAMGMPSEEAKRDCLSHYGLQSSKVPNSMQATSKVQC